MRLRLTAGVILPALVGLAACGGGGSSPATAPRSSAPRAATTAPTTAAAATADATPATACRRVPRGTVRAIASHGTPLTRFNARGAAAVRVDSGYAVSLLATTGRSERMATWVVDRLRAPRTVTSGNIAALRVTNWPLDAPGAEALRRSQVCATQRLRGPGPLAP